MPLLNDGYRGRPFYMLNAHWETIIPSMFFKVKGVYFDRQRLELPDGDFLDIDWLHKNRKQCLIITHGLEGGSDKFYVKRTARYFDARGWDTAAWNCRSCSGEMNRLPRFYHHGETGDLGHVIDEVIRKGYEKIVLLGYSMGGSMTLKYLGERKPPEEIKSALTFSVPCNLRDSAEQLLKEENRMYEQRFLKKLIEKIKLKAQTHTQINAEDIDKIQNFDDFHELYTAPLHGFKDKEDFFNQATCDQFLDRIEVPVLILNAANDPMLGEKCYPTYIAEKSKYIHLEITWQGGHCGYTQQWKPFSYMEERSAWFLSEQGV